MWKAILSAIGAYVLTLIVAILLAVVLLAELSPRGCGAVSQTLRLLWGTVAALFLTSAIAMGVTMWKMTPRGVGRVVLLMAYSIALLASYLVIAFGLMIALNC